MEKPISHQRHAGLEHSNNMANETVAEEPSEKDFKSYCPVGRAPNS